MKVLVTGGSGQIGAAVLREAPKGVRCVAPTRAEMDLSDPASIAAMLNREKPEFVINCGAYTDVEGAEDDESRALQVNARAPEVIADWAAKNGGRLIQLSSDYVFDGKASRPYLPSDERLPLSVYGKSKAAGEDAASEHAIILRTSWVYAAGGSNFVRTMLRLMRRGDPIRVVDDQTGAPSWAPRIAQTIWGLIEKGRPGIYHHRDGGSVTWYNFAVAIGEEAFDLGLIDSLPAVEPVSSEEYPSKAARPAYSVLDDSKTRDLLGDAVPDWRENLRRMLEKEMAVG